MNADQIECLHSLYAAVQDAHGNIRSIKLSMTLEEFINKYGGNGLRFTYVAPIKEKSDVEDKKNEKELV